MINFFKKLWKGIKDIFIPNRLKYEDMHEYKKSAFIDPPLEERPGFAEASKPKQTIWKLIMQAVNWILDSNEFIPQGKTATKIAIAMTRSNVNNLNFGSKLLGPALFILGLQGLVTVGLFGLEAKLTGGISLRDRFSYQAAWFEVTRAPLFREFFEQPDEYPIVKCEC